MRLSEAIRLGAMLKPQGRDDLCTRLEDGRLATCALGAAEEAIVGEFQQPSSEDEPYGEVYQRYRRLLEYTTAQCPVCGEHDDVGALIAWCLNDEHRWTREQIADWVSTIEQQQEQTPEPQPIHLEA